MDWYLITKTIHIISSTILFGTGIGTAFFMWQVNISGDLALKAYIARTTVIADFFTTPSIIIQPISGIILIKMIGYDSSDLWITLTFIAYATAIICWLPVVWIQIRLRDIAISAINNNQQLPAEYYRLFKIWFYLGWPALVSFITIFFHMVFKPV